MESVCLSCQLKQRVEKLCLKKKKILLEEVEKVIQRMILLHVQVQKGYVKDTGQQGNFGRHLHSAYTPQVFIMAAEGSMTKMSYYSTQTTSILPGRLAL